MKNYKKIWIKNYGDIPKDEFGRSYEIHHKDGDHNNNCIDNLMCITIQEHYDIHYKQGDYGACVMIAKRMALPPDYISNIQKGKKRPGVGGVKKGTTPWNKGLFGYSLILSEEGKQKKLEASKKNNKISDILADEIKKEFESKPSIDDPRIGKKQQNGKIFSYERAFCLEYARRYKVSDQYIYRIIKNKVKHV